MARRNGCLKSCLYALAAVVVVALLILLGLQYKHPPPRYYASIPSVSLVDSNMTFKISIGVKSRWGQACLERGTDVAVAYYGIGPLAFAATSDEVCATWWKFWKVQRTMVVAQAGKVDRLITEALRQSEVFKVTFQAGPGNGKLVTCLVRPSVDDDEATPCHVQYS